MLGCSAANTNVGMQPGVQGQSPRQALNPWCRHGFKACIFKEDSLLTLHDYPISCKQQPLAASKLWLMWLAPAFFSPFCFWSTSEFVTNVTGSFLFSSPAFEAHWNCDQCDTLFFFPLFCLLPPIHLGCLLGNFAFLKVFYACYVLLSDNLLYSLLCCVLLDYWSSAVSCSPSWLFP